ncbi:MAG TPA: hypothetical protein VLH59_16305 [Ignavibacteriaceae bacterium]|nr:hypothetical protein [Ignavibacteriaceae bacterium]
MKNQIILWLSSLIIVFLIGYVKNITSKDYPITGTFGIEGKKVSYKLDKVSYDKTSYKNIIISDIKGVRGKLILFKNNMNYENEFKEIERGLVGEIPKLEPGQQIKYKVILTYPDKQFEIPEKDFVTLTFWGNVPSPVSILHFILLYSGLLMSIRCVLELFNNNKNLKKYIVITCTFFITLTILIHPLYNSYKLGAINKSIPNILELLEPFYFVIMVLWVIGAVVIFNKKYVSLVTVFISSATILLYYLL